MLQLRPRLLPHVRRMAWRLRTDCVGVNKGSHIDSYAGAALAGHVGDRVVRPGDIGSGAQPGLGSAPCTSVHNGSHVSPPPPGMHMRNTCTS